VHTDTDTDTAQHPGSEYGEQATCRFRVASWQEDVVTDIAGTGATPPERGIAQARVSYTYTGELEGTSTLVYLLGYRGGDDVVLGLERVEGTLAGRRGSFVLRHEARHGSGAVRGTLTVVEGMGTGELTGLRGEAELALEGHAEDGYELVLRYGI
jgi:hypothetical protein